MFGLTFYLVRECYFAQIEAFALIGFRFGYTAFGLALRRKTKRWYPHLRFIINSHTGQCDQRWLFKIIAGKRFIGYRTRGDAKPWMASFGDCGFVARILVATLVMTSLLAAPAFAGHPCYVQRQAFVTHHQAYVAPVAINYFVGQPIRAEAIVEKALRDDPDWELFQKFKQFKNTSNGRPAMEPVTDPAEVAQPNLPDNAVPILYQHCGGCHSGAAPKGGLLLDGTAYIDCKTLVACIDELEAGTMPKAKAGQAKPVLTAEEQDAVIAALSRLVQSDK
jgi:hypothetical protein